MVPDRGPRPRRHRAVRGRRRLPDDLAPALLDAGTTFYTVGLTGPHYDVDKVKDWVAFRDDHNTSR